MNAQVTKEIAGTGGEGEEEGMLAEQKYFISFL